jgi:hypothetical protein
LILKREILVSSLCAFKLNLCRYSSVARAGALEETLRQVKSDADARVTAAEMGASSQQMAAGQAAQELAAAAAAAAERVRAAEEEAGRLRAEAQGKAAEAEAALQVGLVRLLAQHFSFHNTYTHFYISRIPFQ